MKKTLISICAIFVLSLIVYKTTDLINGTNNNKTQVTAQTEAAKEYSHTNKTLSPVKVDFKAVIDVKQNNDGYYINKAEYTDTLANNVKEDSFQISSVNADLTDNGKTYAVTATGNYVKDGIDMGPQSVSAYYRIDTSTGKITSSDN